MFRSGTNCPGLFFFFHFSRSRLRFSKFTPPVFYSSTQNLLRIKKQEEKNSWPRAQPPRFLRSDGLKLAPRAASPLTRGINRSISRLPEHPKSLLVPRRLLPGLFLAPWCTEPARSQLCSLAASAAGLNEVLLAKGDGTAGLLPPHCGCGCV